MRPAEDGLDAATMRSLWRSVVGRAASDAIRRDQRLSGGTSNGADAVTSGARAWLLYGGAARDLVLLAADIDIDWWNAEAVPRLRQLFKLADAGQLPLELASARMNRRPRAQSTPSISPPQPAPVNPRAEAA